MAKIYSDAEKITFEDGTGGTVELSNSGKLTVKGPSGSVVGKLDGDFTGSMKLGVFTFTQSTDKSGSISFTNGVITGTLDVANYNQVTGVSLSADKILSGSVSLTRDNGKWVAEGHIAVNIFGKTYVLGKKELDINVPKNIDELSESLKNVLPVINLLKEHRKEFEDIEKQINSNLEVDRKNAANRLANLLIPYSQVASYYEGGEYINGYDPLAEVRNVLKQELEIALRPSADAWGRLPRDADFGKDPNTGEGGGGGDINTGYIEIPGGVPVVEVGGGIDRPGNDRPGIVIVGPITIGGGGGGGGGGGEFGDPPKRKKPHETPLSLPSPAENEVQKGYLSAHSSQIKPSTLSDNKVNPHLDALISAMAGMKDSGSAPLSFSQHNLETLQPVYAASLN